MHYLGAFLVEQGIITKTQLEDGLRFQRERNLRLGEVAIDKGLLTPEAVDTICQSQREDAALFGTIALREHRISSRELDELLFAQKVDHAYLGEALLRCGHIDEKQYRLLLDRHYALQDAGRINLRYLVDFFSENIILDQLVTALARAIRRYGGEPLDVTGVGTPFSPHVFPCRALLEGEVLDDRPLSALICLSQSLTDHLRDSLPTSGLDGLGDFFTTVAHYSRDLMREAGLILAGERTLTGQALTADPDECIFLRCQSPSGEAGLVLWLPETDT